MLLIKKNGFKKRIISGMVHITKNDVKKSVRRAIGVTVYNKNNA